MTERPGQPQDAASWVDTHCHLQLSEEPAAALLDRAHAAGVAWVVAPGTDLMTSRQSVALASAFPGTVRATAGLHPHQASRWPQQRDALQAMIDEVSAIGECGLDFYRDLSPRSAQVAAFEDQVRLAVAVGKPLIVHCRDAFTEVHGIIEGSGWAQRTLLHCWTGGPRWTKRFRDLGVWFSFAGPVAFETGDTVRRGAAEAPPERSMVETDTPYLTPPPNRGEPNEPANVVRVGEALAGVWGMDRDEVAGVTAGNAARFFGHG